MTVPNVRLTRAARSTSESAPPRRPSLSHLAPPPTIPNVTPQKASRTSKTSQRHVVLPSEPQTRPLLEEEVPLPDVRNEGERMSKEERHRAGYNRLTAYCCAEGIRMRHVSAFLKREHAVVPRVFDEAVYAVYHLPLLSGYVSSVNVRSSAPPLSPAGESILSRMSEAEEYGYEGTYFPPPDDDAARFSTDGYISTSPQQRRVPPQPQQRRTDVNTESIADVVFFSYGVAVFFGLAEREEHAILDDLESAGVWIRRRPENDWEVEECHFMHDPTVAYPRIYNDFFTLRSRSHLLKLSIAHALAQSTLLAHYETRTSAVLQHSGTTRLPQELARTGVLALRRRDALRLTGHLFRLRTEINLVSNVLDVPGLFWSEASLKGLYDGVREYLEIGPRVGVLNERLGVASDLLDIIHEHVNNGAMHRITWIIIWLIVVACLVELGEVIARLAVHAGKSSSATTAVVRLTREEALQALERVMKSK